MSTSDRPSLIWLHYGMFCLLYCILFFFCVWLLFERTEIKTRLIYGSTVGSIFGLNKEWQSFIFVTYLAKMLFYFVQFDLLSNANLFSHPTYNFVFCKYFHPMCLSHDWWIANTCTSLHPYFVFSLQTNENLWKLFFFSPNFKSRED